MNAYTITFLWLHILMKCVFFVLTLTLSHILVNPSFSGSTVANNLHKYTIHTNIVTSTIMRMPRVISYLNRQNITRAIMRRNSDTMLPRK